jgi:hypothetical protein
MSLADAPTQLIVVLNNPKLTSSIVPQGSNESVVAAPRKGRGFAFLQGIANVTGNITLLLHSDTIPPIGWDHAILTALEDPQVVGGGFSLTYDKPKPNNAVCQCLKFHFSKIYDLYNVCTDMVE